MARGGRGPGCHSLVSRLDMVMLVVLWRAAPGVRGRRGLVLHLCMLLFFDAMLVIRIWVGVGIGEWMGQHLMVVVDVGGNLHRG